MYIYRHFRLQIKELSKLRLCPRVALICAIDKKKC